MELATAKAGFWLQSVWERVSQFLAELHRRRPPRQLRVQETLALGEKRQLMIVECGSRRLLIGAAGNFIGALAELGGKDTRDSGEHP